jgi:hypothetical protein
MTEREWLGCEDIGKLLEYMTGRASSRKFRLFGCACCRRIWHLLNEPSRNAVSVAERYADGLATDGEVEAARRDMNECCTEAALTPGLPAEYSWAYSAARMVLFDTPSWKPNSAEQWAFGATRAAAEAAWRHNGDGGPGLEGRHQLALLRDVFENPYRPGWIDPGVLTPAVASLAEVIYAKSAFDRLPVLADALEEAGCDDEDVLGYCRHGGPHVRGCFVVDLVLGKE